MPITSFVKKKKTSTQRWPLSIIIIIVTNGLYIYVGSIYIYPFYISELCDIYRVLNIQNEVPTKLGTLHKFNFLIEHYRSMLVF